MMGDAPPEGRAAASSVNALAGVARLLVPMACAFVTRTVFAWTLGSACLGAVGAMQDAIRVLSLMELGFGSTMAYLLYRPVAAGDAEEIKSLMRLYARAYRVVGLAVLAVGAAASPLIVRAAGDAVPVPELLGAWAVMLANAAATYFFGYKQMLFVARQRAYRCDLVRVAVAPLLCALQVGALVLTRSFLLYVACTLVQGAAASIWLSRRATKTYPLLAEKDARPLSPKRRRFLRSRVAAMFCHQVGDVAVNGTDVLLMSLLVSVGVAGLYSNYLLVATALSSVVVAAFSGAAASVGNLAALEGASTQAAWRAYRRLDALNNFASSTVAVCVLFLLQPFMRLWLGDEFLLGDEFVLALAVGLFLPNARQAARIFADARGLFWNTRFVPLAEGVVDLALTVAFCLMWGAIGVPLATAAGFALFAPVNMYVVYRRWFGLPRRRFFADLVRQYAQVTLVAAVVGVAVLAVGGDAAPFPLRCAVVVPLTVGIELAILWRSGHVPYLVGVLRGLARGMRRRKEGER